jgi:succinoglycan biosynthesis protein ExoM
MTIRVDIGVCTYRRPGLVETLASLAALDLPPGVRIRTIVADNDADPEARERALAAARRHGLDLAYVHAPARNISIARNACLDAAQGDFLAFIDDDEWAAPGWLAALLATARSGGFDAVLGPVEAVYGEDAPGWMSLGDFHSTRPAPSGGRILKGYAGNVLIRRDAIVRHGLRFDLGLGRQGGEDDQFFYRLTDAGGTIGFAPEALAFERVPAARASLRWLIKRSFRTGQTHAARLLSQGRGAARLPQFALAAGKASACLAGALAALPWATRRGRWLVRGALHVGVAARLAGFKAIELY